MKDKTIIRVEQFNKCLPELSLESQEDLRRMLKDTPSQMASGGGIMSTKELIVMVCRFLNEVEDLEMI